MDETGLVGSRNALSDVPGMRVGHATLAGDEGALTGNTVVLAPEGGAVAAVDVRGGGPGTRETDALDPRNAVRTVDAVLLSGGSAYGLSAADGVLSWLEEQHRGVPVGPRPGQVVPVVPSAVLFDLGRGGDFSARPDAATGRRAVEDAARQPVGAPVPQGNVGAGTGAVVGQVKGGIGTASVLLGDGTVVAALVALNAAGSAVDPRTGLPYGLVAECADASSGQGEFGLRAPDAAEVAAAERAAGGMADGRERLRPLNTTLGVVATSARLDRAWAAKLAGVAHDGIARAARPVHSLVDGDTVFALATGESALPAGPADEIAAVNRVLAAGADAVSRAMVHALLAAEPVTTAWGHLPSYRELYPSALRAGPPSSAL